MKRQFPHPVHEAFGDPGPFDAAAVGSYRAAASVWQLTVRQLP
jgi:hypothetical protein